MPSTSHDRPLTPLGPMQSALTAGAFLFLVVVIALGSASTDGGPEGSAVITQYGPALFRAVFILVVIAEALVIALVIWALWPDGEKRGQPRAKRSWLAMMLASFVQLASALVFLWYLRHQRKGMPFLSDGAGGAGFSNLKPPPFTKLLPSGGEWLTALLVVAVLGLVAWRLWRTYGLRRRSLEVILAEQFTEAVDLSIEELESDPDARRAVIGAYGRMTAALSGGGLPRQAHETALEYLVRVLAELAVPERPVRRLTELFQFAKFSPHTVGDDMKADALSALREIRAGLTGAGSRNPAARLEPSR